MTDSIEIPAADRRSSFFTTATSLKKLYAGDSYYDRYRK